MNQLSFFENDKAIQIPGLTYLPEYITSDEESELINIIDTQLWITELKRRVQHYGYRYDYKNRSINPQDYLGTMPDFLYNICAKLLDDGIFSIIPDQVIINEYLPGQGIMSHIDCVPCFSDTICSLSLSSSCIMDFTQKDSIPMLLDSRSLFILKGDARYSWKHGIAARKHDSYQGIKILRKRRLSLTFRKVKLFH